MSDHDYEGRDTEVEGADTWVTSGDGEANDGESDAGRRTCASRQTDEAQYQWHPEQEEILPKGLRRCPRQQIAETATVFRFADEPLFESPIRTTGQK